MQQRLIKVHEDDNVVIALTDFSQGEIVHFQNDNLQMQNPTKAKHKIALEELPKGAKITMYGVLVGKET